MDPACALPRLCSLDGLVDVCSPTSAADMVVRVWPTDKRVERRRRDVPKACGRSRMGDRWVASGILEAAATACTVLCTAIYGPHGSRLSTASLAGGSWGRYSASSRHGQA